MGQTDKQFSGFLRMLIARLKAVLRETNPNQQMEMLQEILKDLQTTLEDEPRLAAGSAVQRQRRGRQPGKMWRQSSGSRAASKS